MKIVSVSMVSTIFAFPIQMEQELFLANTVLQVLFWLQVSTKLGDMVKHWFPLSKQ